MKEKKEKMNPATYILAVSAMAGVLIAMNNDDLLAGICFLVMIVMAIGIVGAIMMYIIIGLIRSLK